MADLITRIQKFDKVRDSIGPIIQDAANEKIISINKLAEDLEISGSTMYNFINGGLRPDPQQLKGIIAYIHSRLITGVRDEPDEEEDMGEDRDDDKDDDTDVDPIFKAPLLSEEASSQTEDSAISSIPIGTPRTSILIDVRGESVTVDIQKVGDLWIASSPQYENKSASAKSKIEAVTHFKAKLFEEDSPA